MSVKMLNVEFVSNELESEKPDYNKVKDHIIRAFYSESKQELKSINKIGEEERKTITKWLNKEYPEISFYLKRIPTNSIAFYANLSNKIEIISQYHCPNCDGEHPVIIFDPIRISPISFRNQDKKIKHAYEKAIDHWFKSQQDNYSFGVKRICLQIVFIIGKSTKEKDVDNMGKILVDILQKKIYDNDKQIDHLNILKIRWEGNEEYIRINIRESVLNNHDNVLFKEVYQNWDDIELLKIENFLD